MNLASLNPVSLIERLRRTPAMAAVIQQAEQELAAEHSAKRRSLVASLAKLEADAQAAEPEIVERMKRATARLRSAEQELHEARVALAVEEAAQSNATSASERAQSSVRRDLIDMAPPCIAAFATECDEAEKRIRAAQYQRCSSNDAPLKPFYETQERIDDAQRRHDAHLECEAAVQEVKRLRRQADAFALTPKTDDEILADVNACRRELQAVLKALRA